MSNLDAIRLYNDAPALSYGAQAPSMESLAKLQDDYSGVLQDSIAAGRPQAALGQILRELSSLIEDMGPASAPAPSASSAPSTQYGNGGSHDVIGTVADMLIGIGTLLSGSLPESQDLARGDELSGGSVDD